MEKEMMKEAPGMPDKGVSAGMADATLCGCTMEDCKRGYSKPNDSGSTGE